MVDEDGIPNTMYIDRAMPLQRKTDMNTRTKPNLHRPARSTVSHDIDTKYKEPWEYLNDNVLNNCHKQEYLIYKVRWHGYAAEEDT